MWWGRSVWVRAYLAVGAEAVGVAKIHTSTRVAFAENRANCTLLPTIVAPRGVVAAAGLGARRKVSSRTAGARLRRAERKAAGVTWGLMFLSPGTRHGALKRRDPRGG